MLRNSTLILALLGISLLTATSCATRHVISTADDVDSVLKSIPVGKSRYVELVGTLRPYSGSFPKGHGLSEIAVGGKILLLHSFAIHADDEAPYLNKVVSAHVKISHYPLPDSNPASQIGGHWITEIGDLKLKE